MPRDHSVDWLWSAKERQCGSPAAAAAGSIRRTHPCASTLSALTESRCAARPSTVNDGEVAVASKAELRLRRSAQAAAGAVERSAGAEKRRTVGDRGALIDRLWPAIEALPDPELEPDAKRQSKQDKVIAMLQRPEGATVDEVARVTGWQRHTVRGVFSGTLKKKLGLTLASAKEERGRVYRIDRPASV